LTTKYGFSVCSLSARQLLKIGSFKERQWHKKLKMLQGELLGIYPFLNGSLSLRSPAKVFWILFPYIFHIKFEALKSSLKNETVKTVNRVKVAQLNFFFPFLVVFV